MLPSSISSCLELLRCTGTLLLGAQKLSPEEEGTVLWSPAAKRKHHSVFSPWPHCLFRTAGGLHRVISAIFLGRCCISMHPLSLSWAVLPQCRDEILVLTFLKSSAAAPGAVCVVRG